MDKKLLWILTMVLAISNVAKSQSKNNLSVELFVNDTLYYGEMAKVTALIETNCFLPVTLHLEKMVSPSESALSDKRVYLEIQHENEVYVETFPTLLISGEVERVRLSKWRSCRVLGLFNFDNLLPITKMDEINRKDWYKNRNRDFGEYQFKVMLVTDDNDTISSDPVNIIYIEKKIN